MAQQLPDFIDWRARDLASSVNSQDLTAVQVTQAALARIAWANPLLNAFTDIDHVSALKQAAAVDLKIQQGARLPLAGVPFSVKDNLWVAGRPATYGSKFFADHIAPRDSWSVEQLKKQGAICVGITNTPEFASKGVTQNPLHGTTRNPWDLDLTPGGSSGGAVAGVAAGLVPVALGTDAGGSIRRPAAHTGLVGFKCTLGLIPNPWGFPDPSHDLSTIGVAARDVQDCALMLDALVEHHPNDPLSHPLPMAMVAPHPFTAALNAQIDQTLRIGFTMDLGCGFAIDDDVALAVEAAIQQLKRANWKIDISHPAWPPKTNEYPLLAQQQAGLAALFGQAYQEAPEIFDPDIGVQIEEGQKATGALIAGLSLQRNKLREAFNTYFDSYDLLLCPTVPVEPWACDGPPPNMIGDRPATPRGHAPFTPLFNYCDAPALSVPCGFGKNGLPLGLQIVGPRYGDLRVLQFGFEVQKVLNLKMNSPMILAQSEQEYAQQSAQ
ncbi:MAG: amidase [Alcaligenaceae bacterium]|nr:amidase [Alcaligenaceae bacterium]